MICLVDAEKISNMEIHKEQNYVLVNINPKFFPLEVIYSALYIFLDKAYAVVDGDPAIQVIVELKPKKESNLEELGREFNNELLSYANYSEMSKKNQKIREILLSRALLPAAKPEIKPEEEFEDPEGIAIPWEEKYGKGSETPWEEEGSENSETKEEQNPKNE